MPDTLETSIELDVEVLFDIEPADPSVGIMNTSILVEYAWINDAGGDPIDVTHLLTDKDKQRLVDEFIAENDEQKGEWEYEQRKYSEHE